MEIYQNFRMPCRQVCAFALKVRVALITLVNKFYTVDTYRATYNRLYVLVLIVKLLLSPLLPPKVIGPGDDLLRDARKAVLSRNI